MIVKNCENCQVEFFVNDYRKDTAKTCSKKCLGELQSAQRKGKFGVGESNPRYKNGISMYRRYKKECCERCGSNNHLVVHHIDEDRTNNDPSNLETVCRSCHQKEHNVIRNIPRDKMGPPRIQPRICEWCGSEYIRTHMPQRFCSRSCYMYDRNNPICAL